MPETTEAAERPSVNYLGNNRIVRLTFFALSILIIASIGSNAWQFYANRQKSLQVDSLTSQITHAKSDIATLTAQNTGAVTPPAQPASPANQVGLISNKITFTLPQGWVPAPLADSSSICMPGSIFAKPIICDDTLKVLPSVLIPVNQKTDYVYSPFEVDISVYEHTDSTNAKDWLSTDYGEDLTSIEPQIVNQSNAPVNGYDAFTFTSRYSNTPYPSTIVYAVVHGSYAVVARSTYMTTINPTGTAGNEVNEDYSQYLPAVKALINSITFHG